MPCRILTGIFTQQTKQNAATHNENLDFTTIAALSRAYNTCICLKCCCHQLHAAHAAIRYSGNTLPAKCRCEIGCCDGRRGERAERPREPQRSHQITGSLNLLRHVEHKSNCLEKPSNTKKQAAGGRGLRQSHATVSASETCPPGGATADANAEHRWTTPFSFIAMTHSTMHSLHVSRIDKF